MVVNGCFYNKGLQDKLDEMSMEIATNFGISKTYVDMAIQGFCTAPQIKNEQKVQELRLERINISSE